MKEIPFGRPGIGDEERNAVLNVMAGPILVHGPKAKEFEAAFAAFTGAPYATSVSSCTAGLHLCYFYLGLGPGDEVVVPAQTHTATAHAVELTGAKPVFVDAEPRTGNIDISAIESKITAKTKALCVVHFLGMPVDMDKVMEVARKHKLFVVEDCALAIGTYYKGVHMGLHGDAGCFSFYPVKHMTTAEGGMVISRHKDFIGRLERIKAFGVDRTAGERKIPGVYDVKALGYNYRMSEIHAAIGIEQIKKLPGFLSKRKENYEALSKALSKIEGVSQLESSGGDFQSSYYCLSAILDKKLAPKRFEIVEIMKSQKVGTSVYYPEPVPLMSYYKDKYGYCQEEFPAAANISHASIALPVGPHLDTADMAIIADSLKNAIKEVTK